MKAVFLDAKTLGDDVDLSPIESVTGGLEKYDRTTPDQILERIRGFDTVLVNKVVLSREHFEACPELKTIAVVATGLNNIDQAAAKDHGIKRGIHHLTPPLRRRPCSASVSASGTAPPPSSSASKTALRTSGEPLYATTSARNGRDHQSRAAACVLRIERHPDT